MAKYPIVWEKLDRLGIERLKVSGGWLVKRVSGLELVYVPDAKHDWDLEAASPREGKRREG